MIKLSDFIIRLRAMMHDERKIEYSDIDLIGYINDGFRFVRRIILDVYPAMFTDILGEGILYHNRDIIYLYEASTRILSVKVNGKTLRQINPSSEEEEARKNHEPAAYYVFGFDKIKVVPKPKKPMRFVVIGIEDFPPLKKPEDVLPIPAEFEDFVAEYCVMRASLTNEFNMQEEMQIMAVIKGEIEERLKAFLPAGAQVRGYW